MNAISPSPDGAISLTRLSLLQAHRAATVDALAEASATQAKALANYADMPTPALKAAFVAANAEVARWQAELDSLAPALEAALRYQAGKEAAARRATMREAARVANAAAEARRDDARAIEKAIDSLAKAVAGYRIRSSEAEAAVSDFIQAATSDPSEMILLSEWLVSDAAGHSHAFAVSLGQRLSAALSGLALRDQIEFDQTQQYVTAVRISPTDAARWLAEGLRHRLAAKTPPSAADD